MSQMTRRDLLLGSFIKKPVAVKKIVVGRLKDFAVGEKKLLEKERVLIESLPEGLRAKSASNGNEYFGIEINSWGEVLVDFTKARSFDEVFSVMTNETIRLNKEMNV